MDEEGDWLPLSQAASTFKERLQLVADLRNGRWRVRCIDEDSLFRYVNDPKHGEAGQRLVVEKWRTGKLPEGFLFRDINWAWSSLTHNRRTLQRIEVFFPRSHRKPGERWRERHSKEALRDAMQEIAKQYPPGARPAFQEIWDALKARVPTVTRQKARAALAEFAPQLKGERGRRRFGNLKALHLETN